MNIPVFGREYILDYGSLPGCSEASHRMELGWIHLDDLYIGKVSETLDSPGLYRLEQIIIPYAVYIKKPMLLVVPYDLLPPRPFLIVSLPVALAPLSCVTYLFVISAIVSPCKLFDSFLFRRFI